jgi:hypothetical protein
MLIFSPSLLLTYLLVYLGDDPQDPDGDMVEIHLWLIIWQIYNVILRTVLRVQPWSYSHVETSLSVPLACTLAQLLMSGRSSSAGQSSLDLWRHKPSNILVSLVLYWSTRLNQVEGLTFSCPLSILKIISSIVCLISSDSIPHRFCLKVHWLALQLFLGPFLHNLCLSDSKETRPAQQILGIVAQKTCTDLSVSCCPESEHMSYLRHYTCSSPSSFSTFHWWPLWSVFNPMSLSHSVSWSNCPSIV